MPELATRSARMSEPTEQTEQTEQTKAQPTMEQISQALNAWLAERGVALQVVAIGSRTGQPSPIDDFLPATHHATVTLVKVQK